MGANNKPILIYATFPTLAEAERIGAALVDQGFVACVNILPGMISIYQFEGQRHRDDEVAMICKTTAPMGTVVVSAISAMHSYKVPAIIELPVTGGSPEFLAWIATQTAPRT